MSSRETVIIRSQASVYVDVRKRLTYELTKVYNWPSNKNDLRPNHDRLASSWPSHAIRKSIGINSGPRATDRPTTWARPPRVTCVTRQKFAWAKIFKSDLRPTYDHAEWNTRPSSELRPTCKDLRPKEDPATSWVARKWNRQVPRSFFDG